MRAQFIYEKFEDESDPIHDLHIGVESIREFDTVKEAAVMFVDNICLLTKGKISSAQHLRETINNIAMNMHTTTDASPLTECKRYLDGVNFNKPPLTIHELGGRFDRVTQRVQFLKDFKQAVTDYTKSKFKPKTRFVVEAFTQESDPIKDMGIGMSALRKHFIK
jgi:hypothetical protein